jgi:hypothetical protein
MMNIKRFIEFRRGRVPQSLSDLRRSGPGLCRGSEEGEGENMGSLQSRGSLCLRVFVLYEKRKRIGGVGGGVRKGRGTRRKKCGTERGLWS